MVHANTRLQVYDGAGRLVRTHEHLRAATPLDPTQSGDGGWPGWLCVRVAKRQEEGKEAGQVRLPRFEMTQESRLCLTHLNDARTASAYQPGMTAGQLRGYDGVGRIVAHRWLPCSLDSAGFVTAYTSTTPDIGFRHAWNAADNKLSQELMHGLDKSEAYQYDSANRLIRFDRGTLNASLTQVVTPTPISGLIQTQTWTLDGPGNWPVNTVTTGGVPASEVRVHNREENEGGKRDRSNYGSREHAASGLRRRGPAPSHRRRPSRGRHRRDRARSHNWRFAPAKGQFEKIPETDDTAFCWSGDRLLVPGRAWRLLDPSTGDVTELADHAKRTYTSRGGKPQQGLVWLDDHIINLSGELFTPDGKISRYPLRGWWQMLVPVPGGFLAASFSASDGKILRFSRDRGGTR